MTELQRRNRKKQLLIYYVKQKFCGLILVIMGFSVPALIDGDITASIIFVPLGIYLILTNKRTVEF